MAEVTIVNGRKKKRSKKPKKKGKGKRVAKKKPKRKKPRKKNPKKKRGRARRAAGKFFGGGMRVNIKDDFAHAAQRLFGKAIAAWAIGQWGDPPQVNPSGGNSPTTGLKWTMKNYFIAWLAGYIGGELTGRFFRQIDGQKVYDGAVDLAMTKAFWSEIVHRIPGGPKYLGQTQQMPSGGVGEIYTDEQGNVWQFKGGRWVAMMGHDDAAMGQLETATELDGRAGYGDLEAARALDGLERKTALDGYGHLMDPDSPSSAADAGSYLRRGSPDPFQAAYL